MILNSTNLQQLFNAYSFQFQQAYDKSATGWLDKVATRMPSDTDQSIYFWLASLPKMREWVGERQAQNLAEYEYVLKNKDYELTVELDRNRVMDDKHGFFAASTVPMMAAQAKKQPDYLMRDLIQLGSTTTIWDGQNFFDSSHPISKFPGSGISGTQSNNFTSTALSYDNAVAVRSSMALLKDESGETMNVVPNLMIVPPQLEGLAKAIAQADYAPKAYGTPGSESAATSQPNMMKGTFEVLMLPEFGNQPTTWYFLDTSKPINPFVHQERMAPKFEALIAPTDANVFNLKKYKFGVDARWVPGFGPWFLAARAIALWSRSRARPSSQAAVSVGKWRRGSRSTGPTRSRRSRSRKRWLRPSRPTTRSSACGSSPRRPPSPSLLPRGSDPWRRTRRWPSSRLALLQAASRASTTRPSRRRSMRSAMKWTATSARKRPCR
jgi:phage major head subunit gpT-like protein